MNTAQSELKPDKLHMQVTDSQTNILATADNTIAITRNKVPFQTFLWARNTDFTL